MSNPFAALGLPARPDLSDEQVRAAWRTIAAATHPDRPDGGDPARYAAASAAYAVLRTGWGRSEAYADLGAQAPAVRSSARPPRRRLLRSLMLLLARVRHGRPLRLLLRALTAGLLAAAVVQVGTGGPAVAGTVAGLAVWLALTTRGDLTRRQAGEVCGDGDQAGAGRTAARRDPTGPAGGLLPGSRSLPAAPRERSRPRPPPRRRTPAKQPPRRSPRRT